MEKREEEEELVWLKTSAAAGLYGTVGSGGD